MYTSLRTVHNTVIYYSSRLGYKSSSLHPDSMLVEMNEEQKSRSPMAIPSITMFGLPVTFIPEGEQVKAVQVDTLAFDKETRELDYEPG